MYIGLEVGFISPSSKNRGNCFTQGSQPPKGRIDNILSRLINGINIEEVDSGLAIDNREFVTRLVDVQAAGKHGRGTVVWFFKQRQQRVKYIIKGIMATGPGR